MQGKGQDVLRREMRNKKVAKSERDYEMAMLRRLSKLVQRGRAAADWVSEGLSYVWTSYLGLGSYFEWTSYLGNWGPGDLIPGY